MSRQVNTAAIFFCHLQTVSIIGTLQLAWPPSIEVLTEIASIDFLSLGAIRPECSIRIGENSFYVFTFFRIGLLMLLVLGVSGLQSALKACSPANRQQQTLARVDTLEMAETVLFTLTFTLNWRIVFDLWEQGTSSIVVAQVGVVLASILFAVQLMLLGKYALNIRALITGRSFGRFANLTHARLERRLSFLTERFAPHAPYWQYVVWLRQFLLTLVVQIAQSIIDDKDDIKEGSVVCNLVNQSNSGNSTDAFAADEGAFCRPISGASLAAVWTHAAFALVIFFAFWAAQSFQRPYVYAFQNQIEWWLHAANVALVSLGTLYTALKVNGTASAGVEALCVITLVLSLLVAAALMVYRSRQEHRKRQKLLRGDSFWGPSGRPAWAPIEPLPPPKQKSKWLRSIAVLFKLNTAPNAASRHNSNLKDPCANTQETELNVNHEMPRQHSAKI